MTLIDPPEDVRTRPVTADPELTTEEKETSMTFPNDTGWGTIFTDVPTTIKWVLSVEASDIRGVRVNAEGQIMAVKARIPKGIVKLKASPRKSNGHGQMVAYGDQREL